MESPGRRLRAIHVAICLAGLGLYAAGFAQQARQPALPPGVVLTGTGIEIYENTFTSIQAGAPAPGNDSATNVAIQTYSGAVMPGSDIDGLNIHGSMRDLVVVGYGASELDDVLQKWADSVGRVLRPDPEAEKGFYYRSDHFNFAKVGVPALYTDAGIDHVEHGEQWTRERRDEYTAEHYHQVSDEYDPNWDLSGAIEDLQLVFRVGYALANDRAFPNWREGTAFRAVRDSVMGGGGD